MTKRARTELVRTLATLTGQVNSLLERMRTHILSEVARTGDGYHTLGLTAFEALVHQIYDTEDVPVLGMGFLPNPTVLTGTKVRWWYNSRLADAHTGLRPLVTGLQPEAMDFYDTTSTEWWQQAAESDGPVAFGPFVDISGTNAYLVTFVQSVRVVGELVGVVAADVTVATLQALCQNNLLDLPRPCSVISRDGMVIATNAGALLGGSIEDSGSGRDLSSPIKGTSWLLTTAR